MSDIALANKVIQH